MKLKDFLAATMLLVASTGFGATPSKPDFAYPKTVRSNALAELKAALKKGNGPLTLRSLMDYCLAEGEINPESQPQVLQRLADTKKKVKSPATLAMIDLIMADIKPSDSLFTATVRNYDLVLKSTPSAEWSSVINADGRFIPTLYDFAVVKSGNDSLIAAAEEFNAGRPYPLVYLKLLRAGDFKECMEVYRQLQGEETEAYVLSALATMARDIATRKEVYDLCRQSKSPLRELIADTEKYLTHQSVNISGPAVVGREQPCKVNVRTECAPEVSLTVHCTAPVKKVVETRLIKFNESGVFSADTVIEFTFPDYGTYTVTPSLSGREDSRDKDAITVAVSDMMLMQQVFGTETRRLALSGSNGAPVNGVEYSVVKNRLHAAKGADKFTPAIYNERGYSPSLNWNNTANIVTDRAIYHPGDTLKFAATLMRHRPGERGLLRGKKVEVELRNPNYQVTDTLTLSSDDMGRISGEFALPAEGLTGHFRLTIGGHSSISVMVTDYKAPTFDVTMQANRLDSAKVEISGTAMGYNGFPVADAQVALTVRQLPEWVWYRNFRNFSNEVLATDTVSTAADGTFRTVISLPAKANLSASAIVTSPIGESCDASCFLPLRRYLISANIPSFLLAGSKPEIKVINSAGEPVDVPLEIVLTSLTDSLRQIVPNADWSNIPSGKYSVRISAQEADDWSCGEFCVYSLTDKMPPMETSLFLPVLSVKAGEKLLAGTSFTDSHILLTLWTPEKVLEQRWLTPGQGNFFIDTDLPEGVNDANLTLLTLRDYSFREETVNITRPDVARNLRIQVESLRTQMTAGQSETWTIRITDNLGRPVSAAVMLDAYSKALDALQPMRWGFNAPSVLYGKNLTFNHTWRTSDNASAYAPYTQPRSLASLRPSFITWGLDWPGTMRTYYTSSPKMLYSRMMKADYDGAILASGAVMESAEVEEEAADLAAVNEVADAPVSGESKAAASEIEYRLPEVAVALWQPVLTTDSAGVAQIRFTAPNANTTWSINALAYDAGLLSGVFGADIIASKPVMVQPQLPRFMRMGDRTELRASVMNNTDSVSVITSFIELYNPATETLISRSEFADTIAPKTSALIAVPLNAPNLSMIGVRVAATGGDFTDGERAIIPILPAEVVVTTGQPLFLPADSTGVSLEVKRGGVLTFTANAIWECVASLPSLRTSESKSALSAASALFSAATARGLLRSYPEIASALHRWEKEDSVLISRLSQNEDLKMALLSSTPWVGAEQSESEQRARVLLLFDRKLTDRTISDAVKTLSKLQRDGGLAWTLNSDEPSRWVTERALLTLAQLKRLGYLPDSPELKKLLSDALQYLDREVASTFAKNKKATFPAYVMLRSRFPEVRQSAPARRAGEATVQYLLGHWRDLPLPAVAEAAVILNENNYPTTARKLIESLRQHEVWNYRGINAMYLRAFHDVEPSAPEVDMIRSAYIARKHSMDWGEGADASELIAAILGSGANWFVPAANELTVKVNDTIVSNLNAESVMGRFRLNLPEGGKVDISKGHFPAWGGVFSSAGDSITSVKAFGSDELKITRTIEGEMKVGAKVTLTLTLEASKPMDYVMVRQPRCAALEPTNQLPSTLWVGYLPAYREPCATVTNFFFNRLAKGRTVISETFYVTSEGTFALAPAEAQSQYSPEYQAHTSGEEITIAE